MDVYAYNAMKQASNLIKSDLKRVCVIISIYEVSPTFSFVRHAH